MNAKLQQWIYHQETFAGVELVQKEGSFYYHLCVLKKEKDSAKIVLQQANIASLEELKTLVGTDMPIFLGINSKGILNRVLEGTPNSKADILATVFPSAQELDFHVQQVEAGQHTLISVVRQDSILKIVEQLLAADLWVVKAMIGPFWIEEVLAVLPNNIQEIQVGQQLLLIEQQHIIGCNKGKKENLSTFTIGEDHVVEELLMALSMAFLAITQPLIDGLDIALVEERQRDFYYKKLFYYTSIVALGLFFFALLGNYLLFDHYHKKQQDLTIEVGQQKSLLDQRDALAKKYQDKKDLLGDQLTLGASKSSYYADQLAATLPSTLQLTNLILFPKIEQENNYSSEEKLPRYDHRTILVTGACQASVFYNNWKRSLEELDWVASIHNLSYQNNKEGQGVFKLKITLSDE
ncbi:MAG: hypothetical protein ACRBFS_22355 [Aureispira sp.]